MVDTKSDSVGSSRWQELRTESRHPDSAELDTLSSERIVSLLLNEDRRGLDAALHHTREIAQAAEWFAETLADDGTVILAGAGTSGRLAVVEAAECPPTFGTDPETIQAVIAGGDEAVFHAREGAEDREEEGRLAVRTLAKDDLLIALSASSVTPYAQAALNAARTQGARTVLLTCAPPEGLEESADLLLALDTGAEILTGSTRLKAGSATKAALNAITTTAMVRLGKVFGNLMVDLRPGSAKLRDRAERIVADAGQVSRDRAQQLLQACDGNVKTAIVMARRGLSRGVARKVLAGCGGNVRQALAAVLREAHLRE